MAVELKGERELNRKLKTLRESAAKRAVQRGLSKAAQYSLKGVKGTIPSKYKDVRKAVGWRALKRSQNANEPGAKVGAGVGKRGKKYYATTIADRSGRSGVGFSVANIHWWFAGTKKRSTGSTRTSHKAGQSARRLTGGAIRNTGRMPRMSRPIAEIVASHKSEVAKVIRIWTDVGIAKEVAKMKK